MDDDKLEIIRKQLKKSGYENKSITYLEFLQIKQKYAEDWNELQFALFLGITKSNFHSFKFKEGYKVVILKNPLAIEEKREKIINELKEAGYIGKYINYQEFKELYLKYGCNLPERKLAIFLGIKPTNFASMKARGGTAKILKEIIPIQEKEIRDKILDLGVGNVKITYKEFENLYEKFGDKISEIQFAKALGISSADYWCLKHRKQRVTVLKTSISEMTEEEIEYRINQIRAQNLRVINYEQFKEYYTKYGKNLTEVQFAELIGITSDNYYAMKTKKQRARIDFHAKERKQIRAIFGECRFYDEMELKKIAETKGISLENLLMYAFNLKENSAFIQEYMEILQTKKKLFIGHTIMPKEFLKKNGEELLKIAQTESQIYGKKYKLMKYSEDIASEVLLVLMEKYGEIAFNFENEEAILLLTKIARVTAKHKYYSKMSYRRTNIIRCFC